MSTLLQQVSRFLYEEDGTAATEYAVMLSLIIVAAMPSITALGEKVRDIFQEVADSLPVLDASA